MSKYLSFPDIVFADKWTLVKALHDCGYSVVEEGHNLPLFGYHGDQRPETADVVVRRTWIGSVSNDLGFAKTDKGYTPIISEYDRGSRLGEDFLVKLRTNYSLRTIDAITRRVRGSSTRTEESGQIKIRVRF